jgi:hypothetical protein
VILCLPETHNRRLEQRKDYLHDGLSSDEESQALTSVIKKRQREEFVRVIKI